MTITITSEKYRKAVDAARDRYLHSEDTFEDGVKHVLTDLGITVEKTSEEELAELKRRIALFAADARKYTNRVDGLVRLIQHSFPEVNDRG